MSLQSLPGLVLEPLQIRLDHRKDHERTSAQRRELALMGQLCYSIDADKVAAAMPLAKRLCSLAQEQNDSTLMIGAAPP
jgi:hypothetical protein